MASVPQEDVHEDVGLLISGAKVGNLSPKGCPHISDVLYALNEGPLATTKVVRINPEVKSDNVIPLQRSWSVWVILNWLLRRVFRMGYCSIAVVGSARVGQPNNDDIVSKSRWVLIELKRQKMFLVIVRCQPSKKMKTTSQKAMFSEQTDGIQKEESSSK